MAFGKKKEEERLEPMTGYTPDQIKVVKESVLGQYEYNEIMLLDWSKIYKISIDQVTLSKINLESCEPLILKLHNDITNYLKAWREGLGKFIFRDYRFRQNLEKYKIIKCGHNQYAFVRLVDENDLKENETFENLEEYNAISFSFHNDSNEQIYYQVLKIFNGLSGIPFEQHLGVLTPIKNEENPYQEDFMNKKNQDSIEEETPVLISENELTEDYINQVSLF